jgi:hypothetical protein
MQFSPTSYYFLPLIFLGTLFADTLNLSSSLNVRDQGAHAYETAGQILVLYILIFMLVDSKWEYKRSWMQEGRCLMELANKGKKNGVI